MSLRREQYVELQISTAFSFLRGASLPNEIVSAAARLGYKRIAITDRNGLYGVVEAYRSGLAQGVDIIPGAELTIDAQKSTLVLLPQNIQGYANLCRLISLGRRRGGKNSFLLFLEDIAQHSKGLMAIHSGALSSKVLSKEKDIFGEQLRIGIYRTLTPVDREYISAAEQASVQFDVPKVVTGHVLMHSRERKPLHDILTCIRLGLTLETSGRYLLPNDSARLRAPSEQSFLFRDQPEALAETIYLADKCCFRLSELKQEFVLEVLPDGEVGIEYLRKLVRKGLNERYPKGPSEAVTLQVEYELSIIDQLDYSGYFLTVWDIVRWARTQGILCQGRGSAANSIICYALGITSIDPVQMNLLFERFISVERNEPPDIDIDIEHERREEVIQYVYHKYGRDRAAMVANIIRYRDRLALREVAKVLGIGEEQISKISRTRSYWSTVKTERNKLAESELDSDALRVQHLLRWSNELVGFPRHLGLHPGGFVITRKPLIDIVPIENAARAGRTVIEWDKRDVETLGLVKIDLLGLGMLSVLRKSFEYIKQTENIDLNLSEIPSEDERVYQMICDADTIGVFQIESRAQMQMLPRLKPKKFYDLVVSVAIVRPGPIQGDMIHPYLRRRDGSEVPEYPHPALKDILSKTYGVPLFQEQVMKMAVAVAGFTPGEADQLRRAIGWQSLGEIESMRTKLVEGMVKEGLKVEYAERIYEMIKGFGGYGFPESHAASFALLGYASCYLKRYHPASYLVGLLNSQPMGFYQSNTLIADAKRHGVESRAVSVNDSFWNSTLESASPAWIRKWWRFREHAFCFHTPWADQKCSNLRYGLAEQPAVRLGFRAIRGFSRASAEAIEQVRVEKPFCSLADFAARTKLPHEQLLRLASAGAFACFQFERRTAIWEIYALGRRDTLFGGAPMLSSGVSKEVSIPLMNKLELLQEDYSTTGICIDTHPMTFFRKFLKAQGVKASKDLPQLVPGQKVTVSGLVITRQRPTTAKGVLFITLEDEYGHINLVVFHNIYDRFRQVARNSATISAQGRLERTGRVINIIVEQIDDFLPPNMIQSMSRDFR